MLPYRGKTKGTNRRVYGYHAIIEGKHYIILDDAEIAPGEYSSETVIEGIVEVIPETVSRNTGLKDNKRTKDYPEGQEIYGSIPINGVMSKGGDIVKLSENVIHEGILVKCVWLENRVGFFYEFVTGPNKGKLTDMIDTWRKYEVIGTMADNLDLLK